MARKTYTSTVSIPSMTPRTAKPRVSVSTSTSNDTSTESGRFEANLPVNQVGTVIPYIVGRELVSSPVVIWQSNLRPIIETFEDVQTNRTVEGSTTTETTTRVVTTMVTGYKMDIQLAICLGPEVKLRSIYTGDIRLWQGDIGPGRSVVTLPANNTFLSGSRIAFHGGQFNQVKEPDIVQADAPGYVGIAYITVFDVRADIPMENLSFEVERFPNPLSLSSGDNRSGDDINMASMLIDVATNGWGGGGLDIASVDTATFNAIGQKLADEGNYGSINVSQETTVYDIIGNIQEQAGLFVYQDPETGLLTGKLIRVPTGPIAADRRFTARNSTVSEFKKLFWPSTLEQVKGEFVDRSNLYKPDAVTTQNPVNMTNSGRGRRTGSISYPYVRVSELAEALLGRDLAVLSGPLYSMTVEANRLGAKFTPGDIVSVSSPSQPLLNVPALVLRVRKQPLDLNSVVLSLRQIRFAEAAALFGSPSGGPNPDTDVSPQAPTSVRIIDAPMYWATNPNPLSTSGGMLYSPRVSAIVLPKPYNNFQMSFTASIDNVPGTTRPTEVLRDGLYPTVGQLLTPIDKYDGITTGIIPDVYLKNIVNAKNLFDIGVSGIQQGQLFLFIGDEIFSFESCTDEGNDEWTLHNVHRCLIDTVAASHAGNADIYIIGGGRFSNVPNITFEVPSVYVPQWKLTGNTPTGRGLISGALSYSGWTPNSANRFLSPPRPHDTKINGGARSSTPVALTIGGSVTVTWKHRSRIISKVLSQTDAGSAEQNVTQSYTVKVRASNNVVHDVATVGTVQTATFNLPSMATGAGTLWVETNVTYSDSSVYKSLQADTLPVTVS